MNDFNFLTTHVGSVPHPEPGPLAAHLANSLDIPAWTQHPRRTFRESMYMQYSPTIPGVVVDEVKEKVIVDTRSDLTPSMEAFYTAYLTDDVSAFALRPDYAAGFYAMLDALKGSRGEWAKGQVTGPISFGLTVTDQDLRATLYNNELAEAIVKNMAMIARWQCQQLKSVRPKVIIFADEPYLASFGSAFISLSREQVIMLLDEVFDAIHAEGALAGVHCCANTDWGLLLKTKADILNLDAYGYIENLGLYPDEVRTFIDRGGAICWGIVPNNEQILDETPEGLADRLRRGLNMISEKAAGRGVIIKSDEFASRSLIAPACGLGSATVEVADRAFETLVRTGDILKKG
jgi:methionine synthase II (cobalamin-independent)